MKIDFSEHPEWNCLDMTKEDALLRYNITEDKLTVPPNNSGLYHGCEIVRSFTFRTRAYEKPKKYDLLSKEYRITKLRERMLADTGLLLRNNGTIAELSNTSEVRQVIDWALAMNPDLPNDLSCEFFEMSLDFVSEHLESLKVTRSFCSQRRFSCWWR